MITRHDQLRESLYKRMKFSSEQYIFNSYFQLLESMDAILSVQD